MKKKLINHDIKNWNKQNKRTLNFHFKRCEKYSPCNNRYITFQKILKHIHSILWTDNDRDHGLIDNATDFYCLMHVNI